MKVIDKRGKNFVSFDSLKTGDTFIDANNYYSILYMKIVSIDCDGYGFNAVNLSDGSLIGYKPDCHVVPVEAEVSYK